MHQLILFLMSIIQFFFRYSMIFIFYFACIIGLLTVRPLLCAYFNLNGGSYLKTVYAGLYFFPIAAVIHAFLGGIVCKYIIFKIKFVFKF